MCAAVFAPVVGIAFLPCALCACLVFFVIGVALALGLLRAPPTLALTRGRRTVALLWNLGSRPKLLAACCTSPAFHGQSPHMNCEGSVPLLTVCTWLPAQHSSLKLFFWRKVKPANAGESIFPSRTSSGFQSISLDVTGQHRIFAGCVSPPDARQASPWLVRAP